MLAVPPRLPCDPLTAEQSMLYDHSPAAQLTAIEDAGGAALVSFEYNINGWLNRLVRANGLETAFAFDPVGRVSRINHIGQVYTDFTYNPASQIATRELSGPNWAWDEAINVNLTYDVNNLNQYTEVGTTDFTYDPTGNLTDDGPYGYAYDPENRMKWSIRSPTQAVHLRYDGRGRLRRRWGSGAGTADYIYDGDAMIAELNGDTGAVVRRYIHGAGVDDPLIWDEGAGTSNRRFLHADERGSITTVTDSAGGIIARNTYDDWGVPGAGNIGRFQYTGQQWLPEIGLYYYKARWYAPGIGRFMQTDPVGYEDGMNLYAYVGNDPTNGTDPTGMCAGPLIIPCGVVVKDLIVPGLVILFGGAMMMSDSPEDIPGSDRSVSRGDNAGPPLDPDKPDLPVAAPPPDERLRARIGARESVLNRRHYRAGAREGRGEVVARRSDGRPFDHRNELREAASGLRNDLARGQRLLASGRLNSEQAGRLRQSIARGQRVLNEARDALRRMDSCTGTRLCR